MLTRSGSCGVKFTIFASGAPWIDVRRLELSAAAANFASKRPAVITVCWADACAVAGFEFWAGEIVICAAPEVSAWSSRLAVRDKEIDSGRGQVEILGFGGAAKHVLKRSLPARLVRVRVLRQMDSVSGMHFLQFVPADEIQDRASGVALHGL